MQVNLAALADHVLLSSDGKLSIIGIFSSIRASSAPATHPVMYVAAHLTASVVEGTSHTVAIRLVDADGNEIVQIDDSPLPFYPTGPGHPLEATVVAQLHEVTFPEFGEYEIQLVVDGAVCREIPLRLDLVNEP